MEVMEEFEKALTMTFEEMIEDVGFGRAFWVVRNEIPIEYWRKLNYSQLMEVYMAAEDGSKLKQSAFERMRLLLSGVVKPVGSFSQTEDKTMDFAKLLDLWWENLGDNDCQKEVLKKMLETACTFNQWKQVYFRAGNCNQQDMKRIAFERINQLASTPEEKTIVLLLSSETEAAA